MLRRMGMTKGRAFAILMLLAGSVGGYLLAVAYCFFIAPTAQLSCPAFDRTVTAIPDQISRTSRNLTMRWALEAR